MAHATQAVEEARQEAYNHAAYMPASYHWFVPLVAYLDNIKTNSWTHRTGLAASAPLAQEHITTFTDKEVSLSTTSTSHGSFDEPHNLGTICSVFRRVGSDDMLFRCLVSECHRNYSRWHDFLRHYNGAHAVEKKTFWCPKDGCARSRTGGSYSFPRKDKLKDHLRQAHGTRRSSRELEGIYWLDGSSTGPRTQIRSRHVRISPHN
jgi:hypothetical protein